MAIPSVYPMFLKSAETQVVSGTIILNGLGVEVGEQLSVSLGNELSVAVGLSMPVPVDVGILAVSLEGEMTVGMEVCDG